MPYFEPGSLRSTELSTYASQALAFNTSRRPDLSRATFVVSTLQVGQDADGDDGTINFQISPDDAAWTTIASITMSGSASIGTLTLDQRAPFSIIVPPTWYYRFQTVTNSGTPIFTVISNFELPL